MSENPTLLIAGCGDIGTRVAHTMGERGWNVYGLRRSAAATEGDAAPRDFTMLQADLCDPDSLKTLPAATHLLYIAAADEFTEEAYRRAYVDGLRNLLAAMDANEKTARRLLLFVSSTGVYGQNDGGLVDETSATEPRNFNGRIMLEGEALTAAATARAWHGVCVRFSGIYGPGRERLLNEVQNQRFAPLQPVVYGNRIHSEDCAGVLAHLLLRHHAGITLESVYLASDNQPAPLAEVQRFVAAELGIAINESNITTPPRRRAGNKRCDNRRLRADGYRFCYPDYRSGYRAQLLTPP